MAQKCSRPFEVILADNSTAPETRAALERAVERYADERFRVVDAGERRGASYARNAGVRAARGGALAFCDSDDVVHDTWLQGLTDAMEHFDVVGGRLINFGLSEKEAAIRPPATPDELPTFLGVPYVTSGSMATTPAVFEAAGGFDEDLIRCEDIALSWKMLSLGYTLGFAGDAVTDYRHRPGLSAMVRQHVQYGRGMSQVLMRYGLPEGSGLVPSVWAALLRPNGQPGGSRSAAGLLRRASLGVGRAVGIVSETVRKRRASSSTGR